MDVQAKSTMQMSGEIVNRNLDKEFDLHSPKDEATGAKMTQIRSEAKSFARLILNLTPQSREQSLALTKLRETMMWANAAIACNQEP